METNASELRRDYDFPYQPYDIQLQLMDNIYESINKAKISIIESPTGTGKSLSIICSVFKWISDFKSNQVIDLTENIAKLKLELQSSETDSTDWISKQLNHISTNYDIIELKNKLDSLNQHNDYCKTLRKTTKIKKRIEIGYVSSKRTNERDEQEDEEDLIVQYCENNFDIKKGEENDKYYKPKVYYCSRTHSQLSQFISEIKKTNRFNDVDTSLMLVPLSSRANYCINSAINRFENLNLINEKCNDLQSTKQKCCMYNNANIEQLREEILANSHDIEEIVSIGNQTKACPYYSSKAAVSDAEIVILPYNILMHKGTRESFGIKLKDSVVIIDEAHNLIETISNIYSVEIKSSQIAVLLKFVSMYMTKYYSRFNPNNLFYLKQFIFILKRFSDLFDTFKDKPVFTFEPLDFVLKLEIENINIFRIVEFLDKSRISNKLHMFSAQSKNKVNVPAKKLKSSGTLAFLNKLKSIPTNTDISITKEEASTNPEEFLNSNTLHIIKDFLFSLVSFNNNGKILFTKNIEDPGNSSLKYISLNPSNHFKDVLTECRSVILCGGTMKPFGDYIHQLFKPLNIPDERIFTFSCDHVIEQNNLLAIGCGSGPTNIQLNYNFSNRKLPQIVTETGEVIIKLCHIIPKGVVVFFPSYDYEEFVLKQWEKLGILKRIEMCKKRIFKEAKKSSLVSNVLNSYSKYLKSSPDTGAIIFSVIGGKMSEGINFSDELGRGVIVIGLPYANKNSIELKEKMAHLDALGDNLGNEYYENLCMRSVNQSIGRAIRHKNDYATIVLIDQRYNRQTVRDKLSNWILSRFKNCDKFSSAALEIAKFFQDKSKRQ